MYDLERIGIIVRDINDSFERLNNIKFKRESEIDDLKFDAASMVIFSIINKTLDLGKEIIVSRNLGLPKSYREIFSILYQKKIINKIQDSDLSKLVVLRNKISHRYEGVNKKDLIKSKNELERVVKDFIKVVLKEVKKNG